MGEFKIYGGEGRILYKNNKRNPIDQLDPNLPSYCSRDFAKIIKSKYGLTIKQYYGLVVKGDIDYQPTCPVCGKKIKFVRLFRPYTNYCCLDCQLHSEPMKKYQERLKYDHHMTGRKRPDHREKCLKHPNGFARITNSKRVRDPDDPINAPEVMIKRDKTMRAKKLRPIISNAEYKMADYLKDLLGDDKVVQQFVIRGSDYAHHYDLYVKLPNEVEVLIEYDGSTYHGKCFRGDRTNGDNKRKMKALEYGFKYLQILESEYEGIITLKKKLSEFYPEIMDLHLNN